MDFFRKNIPFCLCLCIFTLTDSISFLRPNRLLHLAIIHEAKDYIARMIDLSRKTDFLNTQNDLRQVCSERLLTSICYGAFKQTFKIKTPSPSAQKDE